MVHNLENNITTSSNIFYICWAFGSTSTSSFLSCIFLIFGKCTFYPSFSRKFSNLRLRLGNFLHDVWSCPSSKSCGGPSYYPHQSLRTVGSDDQRQRSWWSSLRTTKTSTKPRCSAFCERPKTTQKRHNLPPPHSEGRYRSQVS